MNVACLISGGKDSIYSCYIALNYGWNITTLLSINPKKLSWMFHRENISILPHIAGALELPLILKNSDADKENELTDLKELISNVEVNGLIGGAIASEYQRTRFEAIGHSLGLKTFFPLWHKNQTMLLEEMVKANFEIIITAVAAEGLNEEWLGLEIDEDAIAALKNLNRNYGLNVSGEGGEYETLVTDCPLYKKKLTIKDYDISWDGHRGTYDIKKISATEK